MKLKDKINITVRGFKTINELIPGYLPFAAVKAILEAFLPFVNIYMSGLIITAITEKSHLQKLIVLAVITVVLNFITTMLIKILSRIANVKSSVFEHVKDLQLDRKIQTMDYEDVEDSKVHAMRANIDIKNRSTGRGITRLYWWYFDEGIKSVFQLIFSVSLVAGAFVSKPVHADGIWNIVFSPIGTAVLIVLFILSLVLDTYNNAVIAKKEEKIFEGVNYTNRVGSYYMDILMDYKIGKDLKLYKLRKSVMGELRKLESKLIDTMNEWQQMCVGYKVISAVNAAVMSGIIYAYVAVKALYGAFAVGNIVQYVGSLTQFTQGFSGLVGIISDIFINAEPLKEYFDFVDIPNKKYRGTLPVEKRAFCNGGDNEYEIEFRNVSFKYPSSDIYALRNISMKFRIGERLAVVGMNGSGKTTFIKLLCRLYDPTQGEILLNGIDIRKYDYDEYMSIFSVVFQDFNLFSFSLGQNVAASVDYDRDRAKNCLEKAGFDTRLGRMPKGLDTCLYKDFEEDGVEISGGEAQKIALARALYKDAPFIVLDEPTAALDPISEYEVYSKFNEIVGDKTAIYISHRLSSCRFCDNIAVFDNGQIVQTGSHDELVADEDGKYYELWYAQAKYYSDKKSN